MCFSLRNKNVKDKMEFLSSGSEVPQLCPHLRPLQKVQIFLFLIWNSATLIGVAYKIKGANFADSDLHTTAQERGSLKGLLPVGTPTSRASLPAFCRQYCWSSAAAWDTWGHTLLSRSLVPNLGFLTLTRGHQSITYFWFLRAVGQLFLKNKFCLYLSISVISVENMKRLSLKFR